MQSLNLLQGKDTSDSSTDPSWSYDYNRKNNIKVLSLNKFTDDF